MSLVSFPYSWHSGDFTAPCGPHYSSVDRNFSPSVLQMRKQRAREVAQLAVGHTASKRK